MKKIQILTLFTAISFGLISCNDFLDVNDNPNAATQVEPELILPTAIVRSASLTVSYNTYGASLVGYIANAGGFSGFGSLLNYNFTPGTFSQWGTAYDNILDLEYVLQETRGNNNLALFYGTAKILTGFEFLRIVDQHGDIPYSEALKGRDNVAPKYDRAQDVYVGIINTIDEGLAAINAANLPKQLNSAADPLFQGNIAQWKRFANTVKLRVLIRISGDAELASFVREKFNSLEKDFLTEDAVVNPGYVRDRPNPTWSTWGYAVNGNVATSSRVPTFYAYGFYDGNKLLDQGRGAVIFNDFGNTARPTPLNQLGIEQNNPAIRAGYSPWYTGIRASASSITDAQGIVKGPTQGQPIFLAAESYFLQAEARLKGFLTGDVKTSFNSGITASFRYLFKDVNGTVPTTVTAAVNKYHADNNTSHLVNFEFATSDEQKLEAVITQKYIAFNHINGDEAWNDYRRTHYPKTIPNGGRYLDIASTTSNSTRPDRLPTILKYPQSEYDYNASNVKDLNQFSDLLFWAKK